MKEKTKKKLMTTVKIIGLVTIGTGLTYLTYKKVPQVKNFVDGFLPKKPINTKPSLRKYENLNFKKK